jgi:hypothetical protein
MLKELNSLLNGLLVLHGYPVAPRRIARPATRRGQRVRAASPRTAGAPRPRWA